MQGIASVRPRGVAQMLGIAALLTGVCAPASEGRSRVVLRVESETVSTRVVQDRPPKKSLGKGDVLVFRSELRNRVRQFGKPVGALVGRDTATFTYLGKNRLRVTGTATFPEGTIRFRGVGSGSNDENTLAVVGGTGRYRGARGTASANERGEITLNTYRLLLP